MICPPPADSSFTRGGYTSVHRRVCSPDMAKLQATSVPIATGLTDGRIVVLLNVPVLQGRKK